MLHISLYHYHCLKIIMLMSSTIGPYLQAQKIKET